MPYFEASGVVMTTNMDTFFVYVYDETAEEYVKVDIQDIAALALGGNPALGMSAAGAVAQFFSADYMNLYMGGTGLACTLEMFVAEPLPLE